LFGRLGTQLAVASCLTCIEQWANSISNSLRVQKAPREDILGIRYVLATRAANAEAELQSSSKQQMATLAVKKL